MYVNIPVHIIVHVVDFFFLLQKSDTESLASSEPPALTRSSSQDSEASTVVGHSHYRDTAILSLKYHLDHM